jgi:hypothetical protein
MQRHRAARVIMRQLLTNISAISNAIANIGNTLIVRAEATRARRAGILSALYSRQWPSAMWGRKSHAVAACFVMKQDQRRHVVDTCRRPVA